MMDASEASVTPEAFREFLSERVQALKGETPFRLRCPVAASCWEGLGQLENSEGGKTVIDYLLNHAYDKCYCRDCYQNKGDKRGDVRRDDPRGPWCRFGLHVDDIRLEARNAWTWDKAYHGTKIDAIDKILQTNYLLRAGNYTPTGYFIDVRDGHIKHAFARERDLPPRDGRDGWDGEVTRKITEMFDPRRMIFVSKSLAYAAHRVYAETKQLPDGSFITVCFELMIKPGFYQTGPTTLKETPSDPRVSRDEMEWYTGRHAVHMLTGIIVRRSPVTVSASTPYASSVMASSEPVESLLKEMHKLAGKTVFRSDCPYANLCHAAMESLHVNPLFLDPAHDKCFCSRCFPYAQELGAGRQGGKKYVLPKGFSTFGLKQDVARMTALDVFDGWHAGYHGVVANVLASMVECGTLLFPGDQDHNGRQIDARDEGETEGDVRPDREVPIAIDDEDRKIRQHSIFLSQSPQYASHKVYAAPFVFGGWLFQAMIMFRIKPDSYRIAPSTLVYTPEDPHVLESEMEWYTPRHGVVFMQRICVRCLKRVDEE